MTQDVEVDFLLPPQAHPDEVADRWLIACKGLERRLAHHPPIGHHRDLPQPETLAQALDHGLERRDVGRVAGPELAAERAALHVDGQAHHHLV